MRQSKWAPSISLDGTFQTVYLVIDDFGSGRLMLKSALLER